MDLSIAVEIRNLNSKLEERALVRKLHNLYGPQQEGCQLWHDKLKEASTVLRKLGVLYRKRSTDPFSLVKCASVLTAAAVLNLNYKKDSYEIDQDLEELFAHVLEISNAAGQRYRLQDILATSIFDVLKERSEISKKGVMVTFQELGQHPCLHGTRTMEKREQEKDILTKVLKWLKALTFIYHDMVKHLSKLVIEIVGEPPVHYSIIKSSKGGSTPFGDFEYGVLLDNNFEKKKKWEKRRIMHYFHSVQLVFQIILTSARGRFFPQLYLPSIKDVESASGKWYYDAITPCEAQFDGMSPFALRHPNGAYKMKKKTHFIINSIDTTDKMAKIAADKIKTPSFDDAYAFAMILEKEDVDVDVRMFFRYFSAIFD